MPSGIARICNDARAAKTRFYVPDSVEHRMQEAVGSAPKSDSPLVQR